MTEEPRTPLTLEFEPDNIAEEGIPEDFKPVAICEPSMIDAGRIFLGVNPIGKRLGVHLLPEEAARIRNHLTKLLMEAPDESPVAPKPPPDGSYETPEQRLARAADRAKKPAKPKRQWLQFRFEFQIGDVQGVIGRLTK